MWVNRGPDGITAWASYQMRKIAVCACAGNAGNVFSATDLKKPLVSDPGMHYGTRVSHVPWCMSGSLTRGGGENVPGIPGACASRNKRPMGTSSASLAVFERNPLVMDVFLRKHCNVERPYIQQGNWHWNMPPGDHCWGHYLDTLSVLSLHCNSFQNQVPLSETYGYLIFQCVRVASRRNMVPVK